MNRFHQDISKINPKLSLLVERYDLILQEYREVKDKLIFKDFTKKQNDSIAKKQRGYAVNPDSLKRTRNREVDKMGWHVSALFAEGNEFIENTNYLPILSKTLLEIDILSVCALIALDSGISLNWHKDDESIKGVQSFRILWGLEVIEEETNFCFMQFKDSETNKVSTLNFKNKEFIIFDAMQEHRIQNDLSTSRTVLIMDYISDSSKVNSIF
jgi:hypothetical protein